MPRDIQYIQTLGLQCSGTNALTRLLEANTTIPVGQDYGGKHGQNLKWDKIRASKNVLFLYIKKDIEAWVVSMKNQPHNCFPRGLSLPKAMRCAWANKGERFDSFLDMRMEMLKRYQSIKNMVPNWLGLDSEELITNPLSTLHSLDIALNENIDLSCLRSYKGLSSNIKFNGNFYLEKKYLQEYTAADLKYLNENYDRGLEAGLA